MPSTPDLGAPTIKSSKPSPLTSPAVETEQPLQSFAFLPLITKPLVGISTDTVITRSALLPATSVATLSAIDTRGFVINGEMGDDGSGYSVSTAGDVNGDGLDDLIVGAWRFSGVNK
jgi:hypothetical protein